MPSIPDSSQASEHEADAEGASTGDTSSSSKVSNLLTTTGEVEPLPWNRYLGLAQIGLGLFSVMFAGVLGLYLGAAVVGAEEFEKYQAGVGGPGFVTVISLLAFQLAMFGWPFFVSKFFRGRGVARDWGLRFQRSDIWTGLMAALLALFFVPLTASLMSWLIGLEDESEAGNTQFLTEANGTWLYIMVFATVIGAPLAEEIFFRGFVQRSLERFGGRVVGVLGSAVLFALPHFTGADLKPTIVLLVSISVVGLLFGAVAAVTRRIGSTILAHIIFNGTVVVSTLLI